MACFMPLRKILDNKDQDGLLQRFIRTVKGSRLLRPLTRHFETLRSIFSLNFLFVPAQYWVSLLIIGSAVLCQFQKDTLFSHIQLNLHYKYIIKPYRLKLSCTIPSTYLQLEGFRNYIAAILTKWPQKYPLLARLGHSTVSACQLSLSFAVHLSVLSACCVFILLHSVSLCSVVFLYSLSVTFCLPVHLIRGHFSVRGFVRPLAFEA